MSDSGADALLLFVILLGRIGVRVLDLGLVDERCSVLFPLGESNVAVPAAPRHGIDSGPPLARWASPGRRLGRKRQREIGGDVTLRSPTEQTLRILEIVGLTQILTFA